MSNSKRRFTEQLAALDDGIASLLDPTRHVYCASWWENPDGSILAVRYPGPCAKCGHPDTDHDIDPDLRKWHEEHAASPEFLRARMRVIPT